MNAYLIVKTLHILSATLMVGTGFGTAFYLFWANRSGSVAAQAVVGRWVMKADWWFTTPAVIFQPLSGLWMLHYMGMPFTWDGGVAVGEVDVGAVCAGRCVLAAGGVAANQDGAAGGCGLAGGRKYAAGELQALSILVGNAGLSGLLRHGGAVFPDGVKADVGNVQAA